MSTNDLHDNLGPGLLEEVAPGVFSYVQPDGTWFINNTGFIVGESGVLSIDTTSTELRNRAYIDAIASVTPNPVTLLVNTHHHLAQSIMKGVPEGLNQDLGDWLSWSASGWPRAAVTSRDQRSARRMLMRACV